MEPNIAHAAYLPLGILVIVVLGALLVGLLLVVLLRRNRSRDLDRPEEYVRSYTSEPKYSEPISREERVSILEQLANKEITREEAEARLAKSNGPVPREMPPPPTVAPAPRGRGCLIALMVGIGVILLIFVLMFVGFFGFRVSRVQREIQQQREMQREMQRALPERPVMEQIHEPGPERHPEEPIKENGDE